METISPADEKPGSMINELKSVITDAEDLLKSSGQQASEQFDNTYHSARAKFEKSLRSAKSRLGNMQQSAVAKTKDVASSTDRYVQENPWQSVGIGALAGLVIGFLLMRK